MAAVPVILDTDMDFDVDDVGALCVLHALQVWEKFLWEMKFRTLDE